MNQRRQRERPVDSRPYIRDAGRQPEGAVDIATVTIGMVLLALASGFVIGFAVFAVCIGCLLIGRFRLCRRRIVRRFTAWSECKKIRPFFDLCPFLNVKIHIAGRCRRIDRFVPDDEAFRVVGNLQISELHKLCSGKGPSQRRYDPDDHV